MKRFFFVLATTLSFFIGVICQSTSPVSPLPTEDSSALHATCLQPRVSSDPESLLLNVAIARSEAAYRACNLPFVVTDHASSISYYIVNGDYAFNRSFEAGPSELNSTPCMISFNTILSTCVQNDIFWGGWLVSAGSNFSGITFRMSETPQLTLSLSCQSQVSIRSIP